MSGSAGSLASRSWALAVAAAAPLVLAPYPLTLLSLVCIAAILASSVNLLVGQVGLVSLGQAGISAAAGYAVAWAAVRDMDPPIQLGLALVVTLLVSAVYGVMTMRTKGIVFLMITLALGMIVYGLAQKLTSVTGGQNGLTGVTRPAPLAEPGAFYLLTLFSIRVPSRSCGRWCARRSGSPSGESARARVGWPAWATRWRGRSCSRCCARACWPGWRACWPRGRPSS